MILCYIILSSILSLLDGELQDYGMRATERFFFFLSFSQMRGKSIIFLQIPYYESNFFPPLLNNGASNQVEISFSLAWKKKKHYTL